MCPRSRWNQGLRDCHHTHCASWILRTEVCSSLSLGHTPECSRPNKLKVHQRGAHSHRLPDVERDLVSAILEIPCDDLCFIFWAIRRHKGSGVHKLIEGTIFHAGLGEPEGPVLLDDGSWAVVEMSAETGQVSVISPDGSSKRVIVKTGRPNGMILDSEGSLWVAESLNPPSLLKVDLHGTTEVVLTGGGGAEFLFPNDLAFGPDGALYMTDSGVGQPEFQGVPVDERKNYPYEGKLFRIDLSDMSVTILDDGLKFANGLAFGKDRALYVTTTANGLLYRYEWNGDATPASPVGPRKKFADLVDRTQRPGFKGGDGLAVAVNGDLYCTVVGQGDVTVIGTNGEVIRRIPVGGNQPTNIAFGPAGSGDIYVTVKDAGTLERHHVGVDGLPLLPSA